MNEKSVCNGKKYKLADAISRHKHVSLKGDGSKIKWNKLHGEKFYAAFDKAFGLPALSIQNSETTNKAVLRDLSNINTTLYAQTSGDTIFDTPSNSPDTLVRAGLNKIFSNLKHSHSPTLTSTNDKASVAYVPDAASSLQNTKHALSSARSERCVISTEDAGSNPSGCLCLRGLHDKKASTVGRSGSVDQSPKTIANGTQMEFLHEAHGKPCIIPSLMDE